MARSVVLLPLPETPTSASNSPSAQDKSTLRGIGVLWCSSIRRSPLLVIMPANPARENVRDAQHKQGQRKQQRRHHVGSVIVEGLNPIVNRNGNRARLVRDTATNHEDDAKLAERMSKDEHQTGYDAGPCQRQVDLQKDLPGGESGASCGFANVGGNRLKSALHRLDREGDVDDDRCQQKSLEAEHQRMSENGLPCLPKWRVAAERHQQIVAKDCRR